MKNENKIVVSNISKIYRIGLKEKIHDTFIGKISSFFSYPIRKYKTLRKLSSFKKKSNTDDIVWALENISFSVSSGEVLGIIGNNGAGKSTLLKVISKITAPTSGKIELKGRVASLLEVGTGFHPELTGRENIFLNGSILGMSKKEISSKIDQIIDFAGWQVDKFIDTPVKRFSTGMRVRLAFSIAAHTDPEILLIDEVLAVGDQDFQNKCLQRMEDISTETGRTIIFVSHDLQAIEKLCDRVVLLSEGKLIYEGMPSDAIGHYLKLENQRSSNYHDGFIESLKRDRNCDGSVIFKSLNVRNNNNDNNFSINLGDPLILDLGIKFVKNIETYFTVEILLNQNSIIYASPKILVAGDFLDSKNQNLYTFMINDFNLNEGLYYLKLTLGTNKVKHDVIWHGLPPLKVAGEKNKIKKPDGVFNFKYSFKKKK